MITYLLSRCNDNFMPRPDTLFKEFESEAINNCRFCWKNVVFVLTGFTIAIGQSVTVIITTTAVTKARQKYFTTATKTRCILSPKLILKPFQEKIERVIQHQHRQQVIAVAGLVLPLQTTTTRTTGTIAFKSFHALAREKLQKSRAPKYRYIII